jgi:hypothetical protein
MNDIHSCSYYCSRPECVRAQRDDLRDKLERQQERRAMTDRERFEAWWDQDFQHEDSNPFEFDSAAFWAFAGWQAAWAEIKALRVRSEKFEMALRWVATAPAPDYEYQQIAREVLGMEKESQLIKKMRDAIKEKR